MAKPVKFVALATPRADKETVYCCHVLAGGEAKTGRAPCAVLKNAIHLELLSAVVPPLSQKLMLAKRWSSCWNDSTRCRRKRW